VQIVAAGRARWKIENENNNVLKNHDYHFDHNFAHGKQHLSNFGYDNGSFIFGP
jgi:hypothetical protein